MDAPTPARRVARFGVFETDLDRRELSKNGVRVRLQEQPFQILQLLLEKQGEVVTREELQEKLWPGDTFVEFDAGLNTAMKKLRTALGDAADNPLFIETVPRRGYRFVAPVTFVPPAAFAPAPTSLASSATSSTQVSLEALSNAGRQESAKTTPSHRRELAWAGVGALVLFVVFGALSLHNSFQSRRTNITPQDTVVLADFVNTTGEPVFGDALKQALSVELGQSPFLNVVSDVQVSETLRRMGRSPSDALTRDLAREVCQRTGSKAFLTGSIVSLGSHYVVGLEALGCRTGDTLAKAQSEAPDKEGVLKAVSKTASHVRTKLGESLSSLQKFDFPADATTNSLDALKAYSLAAKATAHLGTADAIPYFQHAIQLDPNFALAYESLGNTYYNLGEEVRAEENYTKAYKLRDRLSEREKYAVDANYYAEVLGDLEKERESCELWIQNYPRDPSARVLLGTAYATLGQLEKANAEFQQVLQLSPESAVNYGNSAVALAALNRFDEAKATLATAKAQGLDGLILREGSYTLAFLENDTNEMERQVAWAVGKPGTEDQLLSQHSDTQAYYGRFRKARELSQRAVESAVRADSNETAAFWQINAALREAESGNLALAKKDVEAALKLAPTRDVKVLASMLLVQTGDAASVKALLTELQKANPSHTILKFYWFPTLQAMLKIREGDPQRAISLLETAKPYELGEASYVFNLCPAYVRGQAYLAAHDGRGAAEEFEKLLNHRGIVQNDILGALSRLQLARAKAMMGDRDGARKEYETFLSLWKDADPDIPVFVAAKKEYEKLKAGGLESPHPQ